ncbi:transglycosylase SLT domain-containing protein [Burkholderia cepacia]|uniref:transglycosylase SLT domain-containing protein n=1 Tax=Burkholderia cepacia TaxID=292 RepID=UPI001F44C29F|nr:transglycosylase SLT domain-containing protein [Burkholderia cepacia]UIY58088.1 transglycosylase SLT domain-containing protein [Burkholderia cepacia]
MDMGGIILASARKHNLDPNLINAVVQQESSGNPSAWNKSGGGQGAAGAMQVRAPALSDYNAANGTKYTMQDLTNPQVGVEVGSWYLGQQLDRFNDPRKAVAAYKDGAGSQQAQTGNSPYAQQVFGRLNMPQKQQQSSLPGIPVMQAASSQGADPFSSLAVDGQNKTTTTTTAGNDPFSSLPVEPKQGAQQAAPQAAQTAPQSTSAASDFISALGHHVMSPLHGGAQLVEHGINSGIQALAGGTPFANYVQGIVNSDDAAIRQREQQYQQNVPNNAASYAGAAVGEILPALAAGGGSLMTKGSQVGADLAAKLGLGGLGTVAAKGIGSAAAGAALGGAYSSLQPVTGGGQNLTSLVTGQPGSNYWQEKAGQVGSGALLGAATPALTAGLGKLGQYAGNLIGSTVRPFTESGRAQIAQDMIAQAARGGPLELNTTQLVPGSAPTLAEATGNPGIATLQRTIRDINPAPFVAREQQNAASRLGALGSITGTADDLAAARLARANDAADNYLSTNVGVPASDTAYAALKQTPAFKKAFSDAQEMAKNQGISSIETAIQNRANANMGGSVGAPETYVSGKGLQYIKQSLDDQIDSAMRGGESGKARNILGVKDQLLGIMDNNIDGYAQARAQFAQQSGPIDAMQYLQSLNLTDAQGNVTLAKVQNALSQMQKAQQKPGINAAKSVTSDQISALQSIRDDLLRASQTELGKTRAGSATAQNIATQQMLRAALPGKLGALAGQLPGGSVGAGLGALLGYGAGGPAGAALGTAAGGKLGSIVTGLANARNEAIQDEVARLLLNPSIAAPALNRATGGALPPLPSGTLQRLINPSVIGLGVGALNRPAQ